MNNIDMGDLPNLVMILARKIGWALATILFLLIVGVIIYISR